MADRFCVEEIRSFDDSSKLEHLSCYYPSRLTPSEWAAVQVTSELAVFRANDQRYHVRLQQEDRVHAEDRGPNVIKKYVLYTSSKLDDSTKGFHRLRDVLDPLLDNCTLFLNEEILLSLVTPAPLDPSRLPLIVSQAIANSPSANPPLWDRIAEVLVVDAISRGDEQAERVLVMSLSERAVHAPAAIGPFQRQVILDNVALAAAPGFTTRSTAEDLGRGFANVTGALGLKIFDASKAILDLLPQLTKSSSAAHVSEGGSVESDGLPNQSGDAHVNTTGIFSRTRSRILNTPTRNGTTPLMQSTQLNNFNQAFALLREGADVNIRNEQNGYTALHYAVELNSSSSVMFVKLLLSYRASMDIENKAGQTALQLSKAMSSSDAWKLLSDFNYHTGKALNYEREQQQEAQSADPVTPPNDGLYLLTLDGGGSRAVIACQVLRAIEERMKQLHPTCGPLISYFDYVAGTSAGGITALSLVHTKEKVRVESSLSLSLKVIGHSFKTKPPSPTINTESMERWLQEHFTPNLKMADVSQPRVMIMTTLVDRHPPDLHVMCNYGVKRNGYHPQEVAVWEVARATSAAPVFFHPLHNKCADGGLMANNPTLAALTELFRDAGDGKPLPKVKAVISLGTGSLEAKGIQHSSIHIPGGPFVQTLESLLLAASSVKGFKQLWDLFVTQTTRSDGDIILMARAWCRSIGARYFRLSPTLDPKLYSSYDTIDEAMLTELMYEGRMYALMEHRMVDQIARCILRRI